jgi:hypothetical protein
LLPPQAPGASPNHTCARPTALWVHPLPSPRGDRPASQFLAAVSVSQGFAASIAPRHVAASGSHGAPCAPSSPYHPSCPWAGSSAYFLDALARTRQHGARASMLRGGGLPHASTPSPIIQATPPQCPTYVNNAIPLHLEIAPPVMHPAHAPGSGPCLMPISLLAVLLSGARPQSRRESRGAACRRTTALSPPYTAARAHCH